MNEQLDSGTIRYTGRALLQDAQEAMGGNIVRGLVELITNADDAYTKLKNGRGRIAVEVEHRRGRDWGVIVRDRATGMSRNELETRLTSLGGRSSGFERGLAVRGNRGRGAKDLVAFGPVEFETIKDHKFTFLRLKPDGSYDISHRSRTATPEDRERLGITRGNGTVVSVTVSASHRCPHHDNLVEQLRNHFQLRDILSDSDREVMLVNLTRPEQRRLTYGVNLDTLEKVVDQGVEVGSYPDARSRLRLWRLPERCEQPRSDPARPCGILIKGKRAIYENSLFAFENNPHAGWYTGRLECPYIDEVANQYDDRLEEGGKPSKDNPIPIVSRRREGLAPDHPFTRALAAAVSPILEDQVRIEEAREREAADRTETQATRRSLERMAREAARFLLEAMREIEAEEPLVGREGEVQPLQIVPPDVVLRLGEERTLSLLARAQGLEDGAEVLLATEPEGVVEVLDGPAVSLHPHRRRADVMSGQIHLRPLVGDDTLITASVNGREALGLIRVRPALEQENGDEEEPPETLEFERPRYRVRWNKRKELLLRAPVSLVKKHGSTVRVESSDAGVTVTKGGKATLSLDENGRAATGVCRVEGRTLGARARIRAELGDQAAECRVSVEQRDDGLPDLEFVLVPEKPSLYRALFDPPEVEPGKKQILKVYGRHSSLRRYFGEPPDFPGQDSPEARVVLAEVVTEAIVRRIVSRKYPGGMEDVDADTVYYDHFSYTSRLLPVMQQLSASQPLDVLPRQVGNAADRG